MLSLRVLQINEDTRLFILMLYTKHSLLHVVTFIMIMCNCSSAIASIYTSECVNQYNSEHHTSFTTVTTALTIYTLYPFTNCMAQMGMAIIYSYHINLAQNLVSIVV